MESMWFRLRIFFFFMSKLGDLLFLTSISLVVLWKREKGFFKVDSFFRWCLYWERTVRQSGGNCIEKGVIGFEEGVFLGNILRCCCLKYMIKCVEGISTYELQLFVF